MEGKIKILYLKELWLHFNELKLPESSRTQPPLEWKYINGIFNALGLGTEPTIQYLLSSSPSFESFENWIMSNGIVSDEIITTFNNIVSNKNQENVTAKNVLSGDDLAHWEKEGFVIVKSAIPKEDCEKTVRLICDKINVNLSDQSSWYNHSPLKQGIMIQLFKSPLLDKNRLSPKIKSAYQQLWQRNDLMVSMDRVSFNPPETATYQFPGPNLHWDVSLKTPIPFGLQGLLYLTDTTEDQGAFTVIPGFHTHIEEWLGSLNKESNPRDKSLLENFTQKPIAAKAGDFIIWNQCLPHGSRPNRSSVPRIVQYINYQPLELEIQQEWV